MIFLRVPILLIFCLKVHLVDSTFDTVVSGSASVAFYLFTQSNPRNGQRLYCKSGNIKKSYFNFDNPTRFVIHGWMGGYDQTMPTMVTEAWLRRGSYNIVAVDWRNARTIDYIDAKWKVRNAGQLIAAFILCLHERHDLALNTLHVIGFSLGAHVAGYVGKFVGDRRIETIIGLDPAHPLYHFSSSEHRLADTDAKYVEVIHTNNVLGFCEPIGTSDFYVNGGMNQPNCGILFSQICAHYRAYIVYSEAITLNNFGSIRCRDKLDANLNRCGSKFVVRMADPDNVKKKKVRGIFYVPTHHSSPYGINL